MNTVERILVVGPSWVGDMMMAQTLFILLKRSNPDCSIDVLAPDWSLPILAHMPEISDSIASPFKHGEASLHQRYLLGKSLRDRRYDQAIILPNSLTSISSNASSDSLSGVADNPKLYSLFALKIRLNSLAPAL